MFFRIFRLGLAGWIAVSWAKLQLGAEWRSFPATAHFLHSDNSQGKFTEIINFRPTVQGKVKLKSLTLWKILIVLFIQIGNLANDGYKLGRQSSTCSREPQDIFGSGGGCGLFRYGGPTAPFIHIAMAFCLLIPKLLMEAKMIQAGFLPQGSFTWR